MVDFQPSTSEVVTSFDLFAGQGQFSLPSNVGAASNVIDARDLSSFYMQLNVNTSGVTAAMNACEIQLFWWPTSAGLSSGAKPVYKDTYAVWSKQSGTAGGVFDCATGNIYIEDNHHGPYLQVVFFAPASNDQTVIVSGQLFGSTRQLAGPFARQETVTADSGQGSGTDGILAWSGTPSIANGATLNVPLALGYGNCKYRLFAGAGALSFLFRHAGLAGAIESVSVAANTAVAEQPFTVTKRALLVQPRNTSGVASTYQVYFKTEYNKW